MRNLTLLLASVLFLGNADKPDILLITIDTLRADRLGCYGYADALTPTIDQLASEGVRYETCQSPAPITLPSHTSILTGQRPSTHGVRNNSTYRLREGIPTLAEALRDEGYRTGAFVAALPLAARYGLHRGFEMYDDTAPPVTQVGFHFPERGAGLVARATHTWARSLDTDAPSFLWVHFFEPHYPYTPPPPFDVSFAERPYDGEVAAADSAIRYLLAGLDTIRGGRPRLTVVTADHGEGLSEHDENTHTMFLFDTTQRVPLILHWPGQLSSLVEAEPVALIDVAPTILNLVGLDASALAADGIDLTPGKTTPPRRALYAETVYPLEAYGWAPAFSLREGSNKVIRSAVSRAYRIDDDPSELTNVLDTALDWAGRLLGQLDEQIASMNTVSAEHQPTAQELEALASLGYVGGASLGDAVGYAEAIATRQDASDNTETALRFAKIQELVGTGQPQQALDALARIDLETNAWALLLQGQAFESLERHAEAITAFETVDRLWPDREEILLRLARLYRAQDDAVKASLYYDRALQLQPHDRQLFFEVIEYYELASDSERSDEFIQGALQDPRCPPALRREIELAQAIEGDRTLVLQARQAWRKHDWAGMKQMLGDPALFRNAEAQQFLGVAYHMLGELQQALGAYRRAITVDDDMHVAHNNLAWVLCTQFQAFDQALVHARRAIELFPEEAEYHETYLEALERAGKNDQARAHLASVLDRFLGEVALQRRAHRYGL